MTADSALLERVRKLLALSASPNVHEAASAAALAQGLIARHRLQGWLDAEKEATADSDPIVDARDTPLEIGKRVRKWKVVLASALAQANGCVAYTLDQGKDVAIVLIGRRRDREAVVALWAWLVSRIEWLSATHGSGRDRAWHEAFRIGCVATVAERLSEVSTQVRDELSSSALVCVDPAARAHQDALDRFVADRMKLSTGRGIRVDAWAWAEGRNAGESLAIGPPSTTGALRKR